MANILKQGTTLFQSGNTVFGYKDKFTYVYNVIPSINGAYRVAVDIPNNRFFVSVYNLAKVSVYNLTTLAFIQDITGLNGPTGIAIDAVNNKLFICNTGTSTLRYYNLATLAFISSISITPMGGVAVDNTNNQLFVSNGTGGTVKVINLTAFTDIATIPGFTNAQGLTVDAPNGRLLVCDFGASVLKSYNLTTYAQIGSNITVASSPSDIALDAGNNSFAVQNSSTLYIFNLTTLAARQSTTGFASAQGIAYDSSKDRFIVGNFGNNCIYIVNKVGT